MFGGVLDPDRLRFPFNRRTKTDTRDWEAIVKLDASNQIAWNNLAAARQGTAFWSWNMGQIRESEAADASGRSWRLKT